MTALIIIYILTTIALLHVVGILHAWEHQSCEYPSDDYYASLYASTIFWPVMLPAAFICIVVLIPCYYSTKLFWKWCNFLVSYFTGKKK